MFEKAVAKSLKVIHDEAIRKAVSRDNPAPRGKKLRFSDTPRWQ